MDPNIIWDAWVGLLTLLCAAVIFVGLIVGAIGRIVCWFQLAPSRKLQRDSFEALIARNKQRDLDKNLLATVSAAWPSILLRIHSESRVAWSAFSRSIPRSVDHGVVTIAMPSSGSALRAARDFTEILRQAASATLGHDVVVAYEVDWELANA